MCTGSFRKAEHQLAQGGNWFSSFYAAAIGLCMCGTLIDINVLKDWFQKDMIQMMFACRKTCIASFQLDMYDPASAKRTQLDRTLRVGSVFYDNDKLSFQAHHLAPASARSLELRKCRWLGDFRGQLGH